MGNSNQEGPIEGHSVEVVGVRPAVIQSDDRRYELETLEPEEVMQRIERWNQVLDQVTTFAIRQTKPKHWCALGEKNDSKPWLTGPGAENLVKRCGLRVEYCDPPYVIETGEDSDGAYVVYTCRLRIGLARWSAIEAEGHCTSRDKFFSRGGRLSHARVDKGNLQQAAYTNALVNGVCRLLGIRNMTWEELREITGDNVRSDNVTSAEFGSGKGGGVSRGRTQKMAEPEQRSRVWAEWCAAMHYDPKSPPANAGAAFYMWVSATIGEEKRDKEKWTESDAKRLIGDCEQLRTVGAVDAPEVPDAP